MNVFTFQWPAMLLLLLGVLPLYLLMRRARAKREEVRAVWGHGTRSSVGTRREILWILGFVALVFALARPGYDPVRHSISNTGRDVVFVLDVSRSMLAQDTYPSRLESAKQGILDCLDSLGSEQVGLVIYGGSSSISCPLSSDYDFVRYMLSQVQPRSVEFGGTFLLSAIEKVVDQVLDSDRAGFQDVIVLTDGEDHAPNLDDVVARVQESGVNLLVVGLGNATEGAPIPVEQEDGSSQSLVFEGETVYTKLHREALASLAAKSPDSRYFEAGVQPYHLGDVYRSFSEGKPTAAMDGDSGYTVYKEAAFILMPFALLLLVLAHPTYWNGAFRFAWVFLMLASFVGVDGLAQEEEFTFESASALLTEKRYEEASVAFQSLLHGESVPSAIAVLSFNRGLADWHRSEQLKGESPRDSLMVAMQAREAFLLAAREQPDFQRAKLRLSQLAAVIDELEKAVEEEEAQEQEENGLMQALLERIEALLLAQQELRAEETAADPQRLSKQRGRSANDAEADLEPSNVSVLAGAFSQRQVELLSEGKRIQKFMQELDARFAEKAAEAGPVQELETVLSAPLVLMGQAIDAQGDAAELLALWGNWPTAVSRQEVVEKRLQEILEAFSSSDSEEGDEGDWDDYDDFEMGEEGEGMPSSMAMEGELRTGAQMQELPLPNYSADEIMMEEMGSQQFRQEQRAKSNAGKVEKDW